MNEEDILSVPVVSQKGEFKGFVDVLDFAGLILTEWKRLSVEMIDSAFPDHQFFDRPVQDVLNYSKVNYPVFVNASDSVDALIKTFRAPRTANRLHRVAVLDGNTMVDVISQTDVIKFVSDNVQYFPEEKANKTISDMKLAKAALMVAVDATFSDALLTLWNNKVSGIALVDCEFKLCGNLSASDLRGIDPMCFSFFCGSTLQFLAKQTTGGPKPTKAVSDTATLSEVIHELVTNHIHRVFVVSSTGYPTGVISLIDVLRVL